MHFMSLVCSSSLHTEAAVWFHFSPRLGWYIPLAAITIEGACHDDAVYSTAGRLDEQQLVRAFDCSLKAI